MRISGPIALASLPAVPWKNGGGTTRTLATAPEGASLEDFLWRISLASIDEAGSFSEFPGIDRTILLWQGSGMLLRSPSWPDQALTVPLQPFCFRGEDEVFCQPLGPSAEDLNLMVRRGAVEGSVSSHASELVLTADCGEAVVLCATGLVRISPRDGDGYTLEPNHLLHLSEVDMPAAVVPRTPHARFVCITVRQLHRMPAADRNLIP